MCDHCVSTDGARRAQNCALYTSVCFVVSVPLFAMCSKLFMSMCRSHVFVNMKCKIHSLCMIRNVSLTNHQSTIVPGNGLKPSTMVLKRVTQKCLPHQIFAALSVSTIECCLSEKAQSRGQVSVGNAQKVARILRQPHADCLTADCVVESNEIASKKLPNTCNEQTDAILVAPECKPELVLLIQQPSSKCVSCPFSAASRIDMVETTDSHFRVGWNSRQEIYRERTPAGAETSRRGSTWSAFRPPQRGREV